MKSNLTNVTILTDHYDSRGGSKIDRITIHHMAGNLSVEACGNVFKTREASANYGIGSDGRVGCYVEEEYRAWSTANYANDRRAINIELANDEIGGNWHVSDTAIEKCIQLCVDICQRYGFRLNYTGDTNGNLTMHQWFMSTTCPGPYLASKFQYIADEVNRRLDGGQPTPTPSGNDVNVYYKVKTQANGWLPEVRNLEDYAGWNNSSITAVAIRTDKGSVRYSAHIKGGNWLPNVTGCNINDYINGYAGNGQVIDAIRVYYNTPSDIRPYKKAKYKVNNYAWQYDTETGNGQDGYAGCYGVNATKFQITIE